MRIPIQHFLRQLFKVTFFFSPLFMLSWGHLWNNNFLFMKKKFQQGPFCIKIKNFFKLQLDPYPTTQICADPCGSESETLAWTVQFLRRKGLYPEHQKGFPLSSTWLYPECRTCWSGSWHLIPLRHPRYRCSAQSSGPANPVHLTERWRIQSLSEEENSVVNKISKKDGPLQVTQGFLSFESW